MEDRQKELLNRIRDAVLEMKEEGVVRLCDEYIANGFDPVTGISDGLTPGLNCAKDLYEEGKYFVPELLMCVEAMNAGVDVLRPHISAESVPDGGKMRALIGVVEGDMHDIGKNLFKIMLETEGFEVIDLGRNVPADVFIEKTREHCPELLGISSLLTTTMVNMLVIMEKLEAAGLRNDVVVMVGGASVSAGFAKRIGADGYAPRAAAAAAIARQLVERRRKQV